VTASHPSHFLNIAKSLAFGQQQHRPGAPHQSCWPVRATHEIFQLVPLFNTQPHNNRRSTTTHDEPPCSLVPAWLSDDGDHSFENWSLINGDVY
jgi:hypothetical protein